MSTATSGPKRASRPNEDMATLIAFARFDDHLANDCPRVRQATAEDGATFFAQEEAAGRLTDRTLAEFWRCAQATAVLGAIDVWNRLAVPANAPRQR